jgi:hypothetical protein
MVFFAIHGELNTTAGMVPRWAVVRVTEIVV